MTTAEAKARRWWGLLLSRERIFARKLATAHGRRYVVDALQKTLSKPVDQVEAELALEALHELGAEPMTRVRMRRGRPTYTGGPPAVVLAIARTWATDRKAHRAAA